ncbi:hypothetical protein JCM33374_g3682 [Metschnikowia sp. JCM 33374]|nr:hypothetical protein JCM33374_g3682 [Metschnikowia sp. JCM 33374]
MSNFSRTNPGATSTRVLQRTKRFSERVARVFHSSHTSVQQNTESEHMPESPGLYPPSSAYSMPFSGVEDSISSPVKPTRRLLEIISAASSPALSSDSASLLGRPIGTFEQLHEVQTEFYRKTVEPTTLEQEVLEIPEYPEKQEVHDCDYDTSISTYKNDMELIKADLAMPEGFDAQSVKKASSVLKKNTKQINVGLGQKLTMVKEALNQEITTPVTESKQDNSPGNRELAAAIFMLLDLLDTQMTITEMSESFMTRLEKNVDTICDDTERNPVEMEVEASSSTQCLPQNDNTQGPSRRVLKVESKQFHQEKGLKNLKQKQVEQKQLEQKQSEQKKSEQKKLEEKKLEQKKLEKHQLEHQKLEQKKLEKEKKKKSLLDKIAVIELKIDQSKKAPNSSTNYELEEITQITSESYASLEAERRLLHNKLQELQGNIRVFCRIRPSVDPDMELASMHISASEDIKNVGKEVLTIEANPPVRNVGSLPSRVVSSRSGGNTRQPDHKFMFNKVFSSQSKNSEIFPEISQLVQSSLDGFNACVFAYGQTGSGKTWTMSHKQDGMIPLSIKKIFSDINELKEKGWEYTVDGQFVEIYNESIIDLLAVARKTAKPEIKHDDIARKTDITNCTTVRLDSQSQALEMLDQATRKRSTASTVSNTRSSRSHSVYILNIRGTHQSSGQSCEGTLNLVDLAGSERVSDSKDRDKRLKETQAINRSLSSLGTVIDRLGNGGGHVPYRDSRLTYLLQHSLGGDSKTLMFVNISPDAKNSSETLNSLRFATKVNNTCFL